MDCLENARVSMPEALNLASSRMPETLTRWIGKTFSSTLSAMAGHQPSDFLVARALNLFRQYPERRWTVEALASELGTSRAVLGRRFNDALGVSPLRALRRERMERAARLLLDSDESLVAVADAVGYDSEFAFSRAFLRHTGIRPGRYRSERRGGGIVMAA